MVSFFPSDRGTLYTIACAAVAFGIVVGAVIIPILYAFGFLAGMLFMFLSAYIWLDLAFIIAAIVYYTGVFIAALCGQFIVQPVMGVVDSVVQTVVSWIPSITLPSITLPTITWG